MGDLTAIVAKGDLRESLEALRDRLAEEIEDGVLCRACGGPASSPTASLAKQLADVLKSIAGLPSDEGKSIDDDLAERRNSRRASSGVSERASVAPVVGRGCGDSGRARRSSS